MINKIKIVEETDSKDKKFGLDITINDTLFRYRDISSDLSKVEQLKSRLESEDISERHIDDIIRDFIVGNAYDKMILNGIC